MEIDDRQAAQIHGIILSSDSDSDFDGKVEFDEEYNLLKPPPYDYESIKHNIVIISPGNNFEPVNEDWELVKKKKTKSKTLNQRENVSISLITGKKIVPPSKNNARANTSTIVKSSVLTTSKKQSKNKSEATTHKQIFNTLAKKVFTTKKTKITPAVGSSTKSKSVKISSVPEPPKKVKNKSKPNVENEKCSSSNQTVNNFISVSKAKKNIISPEEFFNKKTLKKIEEVLDELREHIWHIGLSESTVQEQLTLQRQKESELINFWTEANRAGNASSLNKEECQKPSIQTRKATEKLEKEFPSLKDVYKNSITEKHKIRAPQPAVPINSKPSKKKKTVFKPLNLGDLNYEPAVVDLISTHDVKKTQKKSVATNKTQKVYKDINKKNRCNSATKKGANVEPPNKTTKTKGKSQKKLVQSSETLVSSNTRGTLRTIAQEKSVDTRQMVEDYSDITSTSTLSADGQNISKFTVDGIKEASVTNNEIKDEHSGATITRHHMNLTMGNQIPDTKPFEEFMEFLCLPNNIDNAKNQDLSDTTLAINQTTNAIKSKNKKKTQLSAHTIATLDLKNRNEQASIFKSNTTMIWKEPEFFFIEEFKDFINNSECAGTNVILNTSDFSYKQFREAYITYMQKKENDTNACIKDQTELLVMDQHIIEQKILWYTLGNSSTDLKFYFTLMPNTNYFNSPLDEILTDYVNGTDLSNTTNKDTIYPGTGDPIVAIKTDKNVECADPRNVTDSSIDMCYQGVVENKSTLLDPSVSSTCGQNKIVEDKSSNIRGTADTLTEENNVNRIQIVEDIINNVVEHQVTMELEEALLDSQEHKEVMENISFLPDAVSSSIPFTVKCNIEDIKESNVASTTNKKSRAQKRNKKKQSTQSAEALTSQYLLDVSCNIESLSAELTNKLDESSRKQITNDHEMNLATYDPENLSTKLFDEEIMFVPQGIDDKIQIISTTSAVNKEIKPKKKKKKKPTQLSSEDTESRIEKDLEKADEGTPLDERLCNEDLAETLTQENNVNPIQIVEDIINHVLEYQVTMELEETLLDSQVHKKVMENISFLPDTVNSNIPFTVKCNIEDIKESNVASTTNKKSRAKRNKKKQSTQSVEELTSQYLLDASYNIESFSPKLTNKLDESFRKQITNDHEMNLATYDPENLSTKLFDEEIVFIPHGIDDKIQITSTTSAVNKKTKPKKKKKKKPIQLSAEDTDSRIEKDLEKADEGTPLDERLCNEDMAEVSGKTTAAEISNLNVGSDHNASKIIHEYNPDTSISRNIDSTWTDFLFLQSINCVSCLKDFSYEQLYRTYMAYVDKKYQANACRKYKKVCKNILPAKNNCMMQSSALCYGLGNSNTGRNFYSNNFLNPSLDGNYTNYLGETNFDTAINKGTIYPGICDTIVVKADGNSKCNESHSGSMESSMKMYDQTVVDNVPTSNADAHEKAVSHQDKMYDIYFSDICNKNVTNLAASDNSLCNDEVNISQPLLHTISCRFEDTAPTNIGVEKVECGTKIPKVNGLETNTTGLYFQSPIAVSEPAVGGFEENKVNKKKSKNSQNTDQAISNTSLGIENALMFSSVDGGRANLTLTMHGTKTKKSEEIQKTIASFSTNPPGQYMELSKEDLEMYSNPSVDTNSDCETSIGVATLKECDNATAVKTCNKNITSSRDFDESFQTFKTIYNEAVGVDIITNDPQYKQLFSYIYENRRKTSPTCSENKNRINVSTLENYSVKSNSEIPNDHYDTSVEITPKINYLDSSDHLHRIDCIDNKELCEPKTSRSTSYASVVQRPTLSYSTQRRNNLSNDFLGTAEVNTKTKATCEENADYHDLSSAKSKCNEKYGGKTSTYSDLPIWTNTHKSNNDHYVKYSKKPSKLRCFQLEAARNNPSRDSSALTNIKIKTNSKLEGSSSCGFRSNSNYARNDATVTNICSKEMTSKVTKVGNLNSTRLATLTNSYEKNDDNCTKLVRNYRFTEHSFDKRVKKRLSSSRPQIGYSKISDYNKYNRYNFLRRRQHTTKVANLYKNERPIYFDNYGNGNENTVLILKLFQIVFLLILIYLAVNNLGSIVLFLFKNVPVISVLFLIFYAFMKK